MIEQHNHHSSYIIY